MRRRPRRLAAVVSGLLVVLLGTQPAAAAIAAHTKSSRLVLPHQRTGSAAGLPHRAKSAVKPGQGSEASRKAARVPGALPPDAAPSRAGKPKQSWSGPRSPFDGHTVTPQGPAQAGVAATTRDAITPADTGTGDPALPGVATTGTEIVRDRTADTSVFQQADGTLTARVYSRPVHYRAADGSWQDINTTLTRRADGRWAESADAPAASFARNGSDSALVSFGPGDGEQVSFGLQGASAVTARASGSSITYPGIAAASDLTYEATASGVKETLTLSKPSAPTTWVFPLSLSGLTPSLAADGSVRFTDGSGTVRETVPHGFMEDSARGAVSHEGAISTGVTYSLITTAGGIPALKVSLDSAWLHATGRVYPVKVDPTNLNASSSTYVETPYDINFSTDDTLKVGSYDGGSHKALSYLNFGSFGTQFKNDYIEKASLYLDDVWSGGCSAQAVAVRPITSSWSVGSIAKYPGLSYGSSVGSSSFDAGASCGGSAWHGIDIGDNPSAAGVKLLEGWSHGGANHGLALSADTSKVAAWKQFASVNSSYPPYLSVTYSAYGADYSIPKQTYTEPTASTTGSMKVTITNRGEAAWSTSTVKLAADVYSTSWTKLKTNATTTAVPSSVASNATVTMTGSIPALDPGQYYVCWDMLNGSTSFYTSYAVPMVCSLVASADTPPQVDTASPPSDTVAGTITPQLFADGHDPDGYPGNPLKYDFQVYTNPASGTPSLVADSGWIANGQWAVPDGKLAWYQSYYWVVADSDGDAASDWSDPSLFSTTVQQPLITSHLGGGGADSSRSFDPQVGDYTTSATDVAVPAAGPALDVSRTYNSLDPRTSLLFGAGWSSRYDMTVQPDNDSSGGVVVTGADGRQERFGRNSFELDQIASAGDQTGDHVDDAVAVDQTTGKLWLYPGPDYSALSRLQVGNGGWNGMAWLTGGDVNGDGVGDLDAVRTSDGTLWMYPGVAGGGYGTRVEIGTGGWNGMAVLALTAPLGSDGKKDLVAAETSTGFLWAYPVNGDGSLGTRIEIGTGGWNGMTELMGGDFNGDGHGDVVAVEKSTGYLWLYPGQGSNALGSRVQLGTGWSSMQDLAPVTGIPGDGTVDFLATQKSSGIRYLYHSGSTFNASTSYAGNTRTTSGMAAYTPAAGEFETFGPVAGSNAGWALQDKSGTTYTFGRASGAVWKLTKITDRHDRTQTLTYNTDGTLATVTADAGDRALHFTWSGGHVTQVVTDPASTGGRAETWTYSYDGDDLTTVCPPTSATACTAYSYTSGSSSGSHFRSTVLDANPSSYWRLADPSGTTATSDVAVNEGNDKGTYSSTGVTPGSAGPLVGSPTTAATFDGAHGYVTLPSGLLTSASYVSVGLWFKSTATSAGVLFSYQKDALSKTSTPGNYTPALYLGTSGKLYGQLIDDNAGTPIATSTSVADGKWHYAVLTGAGDTESLYLDGSLVGNQSGQILVSGQPVDAIGSGFLGGHWPDEAHSSTTANTGYPTYFKGQVGEVAFYTHALGAPAISQQYNAGSSAARELSAVTLPSGKTRMTASYDATSDRASQVTDGNGGTWKLAVPSTAGSAAYYRSRVLSSSPWNYWRLGESSGSQAANELSTQAAQAAYSVKSADPATYHNVTLGAAGPLTGSGQTAATFNGTSSYVSAPSSSEPGYSSGFSVELWFKTGTAGETLFSYQSGPVGTTLSGGYTPALYIGADGHLYGQIWDGYLSPMESTAEVDDNAWHQAVLTYDADGDQTLSVDGQQTDTRSGDSLHYIGMPYVSFGAGYLSGGWPSLPASNPQGYFKGSLAEISEYSAALSGDAIADHYAGRGPSTGAVPVTTDVVTDPGNNALTYRYDPGHGDRPVSATDALGGSTQYTYDSNGYLSATTDPDGTRTGLVHDVRGNTLSRTVSDSYGDSTTSYYTYPVSGALTVTDPRNDEPTAYADPRSSGPTDTTYATTYGYSPEGDLLTTEDADGNAVISTYTTGSEAASGGGTEPPGLVATTKDPNGSITAYAYTKAGDLAQITAPTGMRTSYSYDALGRRLTSTQVSDTYPDGVTTTYAYDDDNRLLSRTGPATTDAVTGTTHTPQATYAYDDDGDTTGVAVADTTGGDSTRSTTWGYNDQDQVSKVTDPAGDTTAFGYDLFGNRSEQTDADGSRYAFAYSPTGELLTTTLTNYTGDPVDPTSPTSLVLDSRAYDPAGLLASDTDSMGRTVDNEYDWNYRLTEHWMPDFHETDGTTDGRDILQFSYDAAGNVVNRWDATYLVETDYTVDPAGRVTRQTFDPDQLDTVTDYVYDPNGNVTSRAVTGGGVTEQTDQTFDALDDVTSVTVHDGADTQVTSNTYDQRGILTSTTDPRGHLAGADAADFTTSFAGNELGELTQITAPVVAAESNGQAAQQTHPITLRGYDTFGDETSVDDPDGDITTYTYDLDGRPTAISAPAYTPPGSATAITPTAGAVYDAVGNLTEVTDGLQHTTRYTYDQFGDRAEVQRPAVDGSVPTTHTTFDTDGEALSVTDPTGAVTTATYDQLGEQLTSTAVVRQPTPASYTTTYEYDGRGDQVSVTLPGGEKSTATYDAAGRTLTSTDPLDNTTSYAYDLAGRPTRTTLPDGTAVTDTYDPAGRMTGTAKLNAAGATLSEQSATYDAAGNPLSVTNADQHTSRYAWDALGRLVSQTEPVTGTSTITTSFGYDAAGRATRSTDGNGNATITTYNALGLPESTVEPSTSAFPGVGDRTTTVGYDANGLPVTTTRPGGVSVTAGYDADGRLTSESGTGAEAATADRDFGYDADGRLTSASAPGGNNTYTYDDRGEILSAAGPSGTAAYGYNSDALLVSRTDKAGTATYTYDADGRPHTATDPLTNTTLTDTYNSIGQLTAVSYGTGAAGRSLSYDDQHRLTGDTLDTPGGVTEASATYGYDDAGLVTSRTTTGTAGAGAETYGYDEAGRLTSWTKGSASTGYGYDDAGNRTSVAAGGNTTTATYNARDQLTGTSGSTSASYAYSARGTLTSVDGTTGSEHLSYDAFDQLTGDGAGSYTHDSLGRLATAGTNTFGYDGTAPGIVSDGTETYDRSPGGELTAVSGQGGPALAYTDQHGDLTATFTATGTTPAGSTAYDPYGRTTATSGTQHDLGYQGGWTDPTSNRVATASRWYDPSTGTFTSHDATSQSPFPSVDANPYTYGDDDPMNTADPSGDSGCSTSSYRPGGYYPSGHTHRGGGGSRSSGYAYPPGFPDGENLSSSYSSGYSYTYDPAQSYLDSMNNFNWGGSGYGGSGYWGIGGTGGLSLFGLSGSSLELGFDFGFAFALGYGSCNVVVTPPPPPPPTAEMGVHENPGARPAGQATGAGTHAQPGTKTAATGPGVAAPAKPTGAGPAAAAGYTPTTMTAAPTTSGLGTTLPVDPSAGEPTTLTTPTDPSASLPTTLTTPVDPTAGLPSGSVSPANPHTGLGTTTLPADTSASDPNIAFAVPDKLPSTDIGPHVVLGVNPGSDALAEQLGAKTYNKPEFGLTGDNSNTPLWQTGVLSSVGNPDIQISISLNDLKGQNYEDMFDLAYKAGVKAGMAKAAEPGSGLGTVWEMSIVGKYAFFGSIDEPGGRPWTDFHFYYREPGDDEFSRVYPDEPDWPKLRKAAGQ
ncbi:LamG-like jellyroll fold domain-containing protein [Actinacidiphila acidipaludis]|uniref:DUF6531 domain-containing protein n=1 Tax=Actinacidiphila acidipaludis TaxID=2873382 RepID=A0ABS7QAE1_9ACTN|nr:LamG-like jellyroll fold domain-containing protein [Streptomyces acidipaludis]MBY8879933.1 DUF6531 domain-containing protein [Streptomyces acidipaludis]